MSPDGTIVSTKWGRRRVLHDGVEGDQKALVRIQRDDGTALRTTVTSLFRRTFPDCPNPTARDVQSSRIKAKATRRIQEVGIAALLEDDEHLIPGYPMYAAKADGSIISLQYGKRRILRPQIVRGVLQVTLRDAQCVRTSCTVAALVAAAHLGDRNGTVRFVNGNSLDVSVANLAWNDDCSLDALPVDARAVPGYDRLYASSDGLIFSAAGKAQDGKPRALAVHFSVKGYPRVSVHRNGYCTSKPIHVLVALAHLPPPESHQTLVRHLNGDKNDPRAANLAWGTAQENALDTIHHNRLHLVRSLRHLPRADLAKKLNISETAIKLALNDELLQHNLIRENFQWN